MQRVMDLSNLGHIGSCVLDRANNARVSIAADMRFHAQVLPVTCFGLVHLRTAGMVKVYGRRRRSDQRGIDNGALP